MCSTPSQYLLHPLNASLSTMFNCVLTRTHYTASASDSQVIERNKFLKSHKTSNSLSHSWHKARLYFPKCMRAHQLSHRNMPRIQAFDTRASSVEEKKCSNISKPKSAERYINGIIPQVYSTANSKQTIHNITKLLALIRRTKYTRAYCNIIMIAS